MTTQDAKPAKSIRPVKLDKRGGRTFAYIGTITGFLVSVAANVKHVYIVDPSADYGAVISAMFWPVSLLLATEVMMRKQWPHGSMWILIRAVGLLPVAIVAAVISYQHLYGLLVHYHETGLSAHIGPLSIDGLMLMSSAALLAPDRKPRVPAAVKAIATDIADKPQPDHINELILVGRAVLAELASEGRKVSKTALAEGLRARGHKIGREKLSALYEALAS